ncbi:hypothetical protein T02_325 [Trichinella nativa]|uniref:Uncharacterized protein n=1 Tax=Trichinella nativa TaxID=6335 RepID=A0A0V1L3P9_9BILA|nr:hypothetical protein T02_325 [Trichinella nativa]
MVFKSSPPPPPPAILYILHYCAQKRGVAGLILTLPKNHCSMCHSMSTHVTIACSAMTLLSVESRFHLNFAVSSNPNQTKRSRALASAREHLVSKQHSVSSIQQTSFTPISNIIIDH